MTNAPMKTTVIDMTGEVYGFLHVISYAGFDYRRGAAMWNCRCVNCGEIVRVARSALRFGRSKSCGGKGCKAESAKRFAASDKARQYYCAVKRKDRDDARLKAATVATTIAEQAPPESQRPKIRRAIDTPEKFFTPPSVRARGSGRLGIFHQAGDTKTTVSPVQQPDHSLWIALRK